MKRYLVLPLTVIALASTWAFVFYTSPAQEMSQTPLNTPPPTEDTSVDSEPPVLGKLIMVGHWANTPVASTTSLVRDIQAGGVVIMSAPENPNEIKDWVKEWNEVSDTPLLIAIDQEGGSVTRLRGDGFIQTAQNEITSESKSYEVGLTRGQELSALGINLNFAPVLDTAINPDSFMFERTFPSANSPAKLAAAMSRGLNDSGVS